MKTEEKNNNKKERRENRKLKKQQKMNKEIERQSCFLKSKEIIFPKLTQKRLYHYKDERNQARILNTSGIILTNTAPERKE